MAEASDFVVIDRNRQETVPGKWKSAPFATGGRNILTAGGQEQHNAYVVVTLRVPSGAVGGHVQIRIIVNDHPLPELIFGPANTEVYSGQ
jgi:hypothetical protein